MALQADIQYVQFYMDGSAARKVELKKEARQTVPVQRQRKVKRRVIAVDPVALSGLVVAVVMLVAMVFGVSEYRATLTQVEQMSAYVEQLENENAALQQVYHESYDLDAVYDMAMAIGMVPAEQLEHVTIQVEPPQQTDVQLSFWESISTFLTGLFA
ncbi:MAG: hypothetical protein IJ448_05005 [Oscillospiraceae bacterium]|nr:hypothetical protein [Oscillospiraceae bacterium]